jgi:UDP-N-acetylglucosamine 2-epimerase (non-hydrolysing)
MRKKRIYFFIGTTAELIKLAPVIKQVKKSKFDYKIISSGQGKLLFSHLPKNMQDIKIDLGFTAKVNQSSVFNFILWTIKIFFTSLLFFKKEFSRSKKEDIYFIVHGDTVSSLIGALIAAFYRLKLVHVESGLRSFNFFEPFPEEICRYIISRLADIHFCPNEWAVKNLENVKGAKIDTKENTLIETFWAAMEQKQVQNNIIKTIPENFFVLVIHRQEHVIFGKDWSQKIIKFILKKTNKSLHCVLLTHETTANFLKSTGINLDLNNKKNITLVNRLSYPDFMKLLNKAEFVVTDGGSNQEELYYMGKPCLILRNHTERIEGLGENALLSEGKIDLMINFFTNYKKYERSKISKAFRPSKIIVDYLIKN